MKDHPPEEQCGDIMPWQQQPEDLPNPVAAAKQE